MQKQSASIFIANGKQKINKNQTRYDTSKSSTITRSETSNKVESNQTRYFKCK